MNHAIKIDYHTHNTRCGHATGSIEDYIRAALSKGLSEIGISDHSPIYWMEGNDPMPNIAMAKDELDQYVDEVLRLKTQYADRIAVRLGIECDYVEHMEDFYRDLLARYPFDYVIGSVHYSGGKNVYDSGRWRDVRDPVAVYAEYYRLVEKSARSGLFDFLAHTSAIMAYAPKPFAAELEPLQDAALTAIHALGAAIEINTSGYRKMTTDPFPTARMVGKAAALGIPMVFSSDAHHPEQVGYHRDVIERLLADLGVKQLATFAARRRIMIPLAAAEVIGLI